MTTGAGMGIGPEDLERAVFKERFRGYDQDEVDRFLDDAAAGIAALRDERDALAAEVEALRGGVAPSAALGDVDHVLRRTIAAAQRTAEDLVSDARRQAAELVEEARRAAAREREHVRTEAELVRRAISELRGFRDEYRARLHAVLSEQLAALDRAGELPRLPQVVEQAVEQALDPAPPAAIEQESVVPTPAQSWAAAAAADPEEEAPPPEGEAAPWDDVWGGEAWSPGNAERGEHAAPASALPGWADPAEDD
jgi:cell division initiation protein